MQKLLDVIEKNASNMTMTSYKQYNL